MKCLREKGQGPRIDQYFLRSQSSQSNEIQRQEANHSSQDISTPVIDVRRTCMDTVSDEPNDPCEPGGERPLYRNYSYATLKLQAVLVKAMPSQGRMKQQKSLYEYRLINSPFSHPRATALEDNADLVQLTGKSTGAWPDYRGRWCTASRGHPGRPKPSPPQAMLSQLCAAP
ncbi:UNVERIFIED_CONTAM: hypothetical protein FKN15_018286 [Acipenser sinensis]